MPNFLPYEQGLCKHDLCLMIELKKGAVYKNGNLVFQLISPAICKIKIFNEFDIFAKTAVIYIKNLFIYMFENTIIIN